MDELEQLLDAFETALINFTHYYESTQSGETLIELEAKVKDARQAIIDFYNEV